MINLSQAPPHMCHIHTDVHTLIDAHTYHIIPFHSFFIPKYIINVFVLSKLGTPVLPLRFPPSDLLYTRSSTYRTLRLSIIRWMKWTLGCVSYSGWETQQKKTKQNIHPVYVQSVFVCINGMEQQQCIDSEIVDR